MEVIELEASALIESLGLILSSVVVGLTVFFPLNPFKAKDKNSTSKKS